MTAPRLGPGGSIAGKYAVRAMLGDSGAVITYQCASQTGQDVAVKVYDPGVASHAPVMKALEQAYAATNALPQNSSAPIIDAGYDPQTVAPYSVTEMLRLPSLGATQRRFSPEEVVTLLKGLARSLDLAHLRQVVHGALKPTNVFVGPSSNPVIVTDFAANLPKAAIPTAEGYALSAPWIAPEQAQSGQVTPAADVFSTALVAFFALTGRSYWRSCQGPTLDLAGWQQELVGPRSPASSRAAEMGVALSPTMDMVLFKALSADPKDRYRSIGEFASLLEESLRSQTAHAQQVGNAATMALPLVGDAPSPLPPNMQKPRPAAGGSAQGGMQPMQMQEPALGGAGAATMALPLSALLPGGIPDMNLGAPPGPPPPAAGMPAGANQQFDPRMSGQNMGAAQFDPRMSGQGMGAAQYPAGANQQQGQQGGWAPPANPGMNGPNGYAQQGVAQAQQPYGQSYGDPGYPPPPAVGMASPTPAMPIDRRRGKSKAVPIVILLTAVALLAGVAAVVVVKVRNTPAADTAPIEVGTTAAPKKDPEPPATTPPKPTAESTSAGTPSATPSASAAPADTEVQATIKCTPDCETLVVDGKPASMTDPIKLKPGAHTVQVTKKGYVTQSGPITVEQGKPFEKTYTLVEMPAAPPPGPGPGPGPRPPCKRNGFVCPCGPGKCI